MTLKNKKIFIASDHAGFARKEVIVKNLKSLNWVDLGPKNESSVDYPDMADLVCKHVQNGEGVGVLICGSGQGMAMRANKYKDIRAALAWDIESTHLSREHNDANILCFGARLIDENLSIRMIEEFLTTEFAGGRHELRTQKLCASVN